MKDPGQTTTRIIGIANAVVILLLFVIMSNCMMHGYDKYGRTFSPLSSPRENAGEAQSASEKH